MMDQLSHPLDVLEARLTMDDASYASHSGSDYASASSDFASAEEEAAAAAAADAAFQEFVYTSPKPGLQLPSTPLSALRSGPKNSPGLSPLPPSPVGTGIGLTFPPISPVSSNAPPPSPIGLLELQMQQHGGLLSINTSHVVSPVKPENGDYEQFLTALNAQPLSPARSLSSCSMSNSLSSSSLSSLSTSASYGSSLASYTSSYNAPPNTFPYNLASRPESPAAQQPIPAPLGLNPAHVNPGALHLSSPTKMTYPHLSPGPTPTLAVNQDGRAPSPIPSPTSASAAITLIGVGSTPQQQPTQYNTLMRPTTPQTPISATAAMSISNSKGYVEDACAQTQLQASTKRRREASEQALLHHERDVPVPSASGVELSQHQPSPSKRSATGSPEKRNAVSSSGGSSTSGSSSAKSSLKTEIWPDDVEAAFMEGQFRFLIE